VLDRPPLTISAAVAGLALASLVFLALGRHGGGQAALDDLQARLVVAVAKAPSPRPPLGSARSAGMRLFNLTSGEGAVSEAAIRVDGLSVSAGRKAALVSIDGKPAAWLEPGVEQNGVTLVEIHGGKVTFDTAVGLKEVALGAAPPSPSKPSLSPPSGGFQPLSATGQRSPR
jgi:hypothetical protein